MRLQREAKMAKKDIEAQIKKTGKINDGFICLPDPEDPFVWYYVIFGLDMKEYQGGFYFGKVVCPPEFPAKPPKVVLITENGRFHTWEEGICLSISSYHPESWNPVWKVNQVVLGLFSFWQQNNEYTYGAIEGHELNCKNGESDLEKRVSLAMKSRESVLKHEKFQQIFEKYIEAIGINEAPKGLKEWEKLEEKLAEQKRIEEERKAKQEEEERLAKLKAEEDARIEAEIEAKKKLEAAPAEYFKQINKMGLNNMIGQQNKLKGLAKQKKAQAA